MDYKATTAPSTTTSSKSEVERQVDEIIRCAICFEDCRKPKTLPCLHTFCLQCIQVCCKDHRPHDAAACPTCRNLFRIPGKGLDELPHNFLVQSLIDAKKVLSMLPTQGGADVGNLVVDPHQTRLQKIKEHYRTAAMNRVQTIAGNCSVVGLTILRGELYVLHSSDHSQLSVYTADDHIPLRQMAVLGLSRSCHNDMTSSANFLYISDCRNACVFRVAQDGRVEDRWELRYRPFGLSMMPGGGSVRVLVTCWNVAELLELDVNAATTRRFALPGDLQQACHAVQLPDHHYAVSVGWDGNQHGVCVVDHAGNATANSAGVTRMSIPRYLVADADNFLLVADYQYGRVTVLSPDMELLRQVQVDLRPWRVYLDRDTRRFYVGYYDGGDVTVIQV